MPSVTFDDVSLATSGSIPTGTSLVITLGYYAPGDGGGAQYVPLTGAAPATGYFANTAGGGSWVLTVQPYNVKQFGAKVDGSTDDTTVVNAAILFLSTRSNGGVLNFPPGICIGNFILQDGVILAGVASSYGFGNLAESSTCLRSTLKSAPSPAEPWVVYSPILDGFYYGVNCAGVVGIDLEGLGTETAVGGILIGSGTHTSMSMQCVIKACNFFNFYKQAIVDYGTATHILQNLALSCAIDTGVTAQTGVFELRGSKTQCHFNEVGATLASLSSESLFIIGILTGISSSSYTVDSDGFLSNNLTEACDAGYLIQSNDWISVNDRASNNNGPGFILGKGNYNIVGALALDNSNSGTAAYSGFVDQGSGDGAFKTLDGCKAQVTYGNINSHKYGFDLSPNQYGQLIYQVSCVGCTSIGHAVATVNQFLYTPQSFEVGQALYRSSGDDINLDGTTFYYPEDTALGNLSQVTNVVMGNIYTIYGNSKLTLVNNVTPTAGYVPFITKTGANIAMVAGVIYQFLCVPNPTSTGIWLVQLSGN